MRDISNLTAGGVSFHRLAWKGRKLVDPAAEQARARANAPRRDQLAAEGRALLTEINSRRRDPDAYSAAKAEGLYLDMLAGRVK